MFDLQSEHGHYGRAILEGTERYIGFIGYIGYMLEIRNCGNRAKRISLSAFFIFRCGLRISIRGSVHPSINVLFGVTHD